jgi:2,4-dienoyl-CoA reductase-like NADH-dependent reductase (Old Yellow Enzyme family)
MRLFSSLRVGAVTLANRAVVAPMTRVSAANDGRITDQIVRYYERFACGGWGLIVTEATYCDDEYSQCKLRQPGMATAAHQEAWHRLVRAVHAHGTPIFMQLQHAGALAEARVHRGDAVAPSAVEPRSRRPLPLPRELTQDEIGRICEGFAQAAARAVAAGFDGIELQGDNGYLIDQFLTDYTNRRSDRYGGPMANRVRFAAEAIRAVRRAVPDDYPVGMRLSPGKSNDPQYRWPGGEADAATIFGAVVAAGASFLHIGGRSGQPPCLATGRLLPELARRLTGVAVIANGGLEDPARAEALLAADHADLVSIARGALANPDWPVRVAADLPLIPYDAGMVQPVPTLDNAEAWYARTRRS